MIIWTGLLPDDSLDEATFLSVFIPGILDCFEAFDAIIVSSFESFPETFILAFIAFKLGSLPPIFICSDDYRSNLREAFGSVIVGDFAIPNLRFK